MSSAALASYAQGKGYDVLARIEPREGFWVNAAAPTLLYDPLVAPPAPGSTPIALLDADLQAGWNLLAGADNKNPSQLHTDLGMALSARSIVSAWLWDAPLAKWKFFAPSLQAQGGTALADYVAGRSYLPFKTAPMGTDGVWLNLGAAAPAAGQTPALTLSKAFVAALRSNIKALGSTDPSLQTELQAMSADIRTRTAPIAGHQLDTLTLAQSAVRFWNNVVLNGAAPFVATETLYGPAGAVGTCYFSSDSATTRLALSRADAKFVACNNFAGVGSYIYATDGNGEYKACAAVGDWCGTQWYTVLRLQPDAVDATKFTLATLTRQARASVKTVLYSYTDPVLNLPVTGASQCPSSVSCSGAFSYDFTQTDYGAAYPGHLANLVVQKDSAGKLTGLSLSGELAPAFALKSSPVSYYDATLKRSVYQANQVATVFGDKSNVSLSAVLSQVGGLDRMALSGSSDLIKGGVSDTHLTLATGSYLLAKPYDATGYGSGDAGDEALLKISGGTAASAFAGDLKLSAFWLDASGSRYDPTALSFAGSVGNNGVNFFTGTLSLEELNHGSFNASLATGAGNVRTMRESLSGAVNIPNRPALSIDLSATQVDAGAASGVVLYTSGQYLQGAIVLNLSRVSAAGTDVMTLQSTDGVKFVIDKSKSSYPLTLGAQLMGVYTTADKTMTYSDNSYERF